MKLFNLFGLYNSRLIAAAAMGDADAVKKALKRANPNAKSVANPSAWVEEGEAAGEDTALMAAARNGHVECVRLLMPVSDMSQRNSNEESALFIAARAGRHECVEAMLALPQARPLCMRATLRNADTALGVAAAGGHLECVKALLPFSDPNHANDEGETALDSAITAIRDEPQAFDCVKLLAQKTTFPSQEDICPKERSRKPRVDTLGLAVIEIFEEVAAYLAPLYAERGQRESVNAALLLPVRGGSAAGSAANAWSSEDPIVRKSLRIRDMLAFYADESLANELMKSEGPEAMPRWHAHQEQIALARVVAAAGASDCGSGIGAQQAEGQSANAGQKMASGRSLRL